MIDPVVSVSLRGLLALLFVVAGWHKLSDTERFAAMLRAYRLMPDSLARPLALGLPLAEIVVGALLVLPWTTAGAIGGGALLALYSLAISVNLMRGRRAIDCGCFGSASNVPLSGALLLRNAILIIAMGAAACPLSARRLVWLDAFTVGMVMLAVATLWVALWRLHETSISEGNT
jgi:uncharacterized membrane protein YphA (DoxX/SURF4 family)